MVNGLPVDLDANNQAIYTPDVSGAYLADALGYTWLELPLELSANLIGLDAQADQRVEMRIGHG